MGQEKRKTASEILQMRFLSDSYRIQTCNLLIRSQVLYSVELRSRLPEGLPRGLFCCRAGVYNHLLLLDAGLLTREVTEVEDTGTADLANLVDLNGVDER